MTPRAFASIRSRSAREYSTGATNRIHYRDGFAARYYALLPEVESLEARNAALVTALKGVLFMRGVPLTDSGTVAVETLRRLAKDALAAEERAAKAAKEGQVKRRLIALRRWLRREIYCACHDYDACLRGKR